LTNPAFNCKIPQLTAKNIEGKTMTVPEEERRALVGLNMVDGVGSIKLNRLIDRFGSAAEAVKAGRNHLADVDGIGDILAAKILTINSRVVDEEFKAVEKMNARIVTRHDEEYPKILKTIYDPPPVLYMAGLKFPQTGLNIGVVGSRSVSDYGASVVKKLSSEMGRCGCVINVISGMARGIDSLAHIGAVKNGMYTAAVLGHGFGPIYPFEKYMIQRDILKNGTFLSEFPVNMIGLRQNFPRRNRVISGLSRGTIIVEAAARSGALITADYALEQGRDVFVVPGPITSEQSEGTNELIKNGAKPVTSFADVMYEYELQASYVFEIKEKKLPELTKEEKVVYRVLSCEKKHIDNIAFESNIDITKTGILLTMMEMKGAVRQLSGKFFVRTL